MKKTFTVQNNMYFQDSDLKLEATLSSQNDKHVESLFLEVTEILNNSILNNFYAIMGYDIETLWDEIIDDITMKELELEELKIIKDNDKVVSLKK